MLQLPRLPVDFEDVFQVQDKIVSLREGIEYGLDHRLRGPEHEIALELENPDRLAAGLQSLQVLFPALWRPSNVVASIKFCLIGLSAIHTSCVP